MSKENYVSRKKKITVISLSAIFLVALVVAVTVGVNLHHSSSSDEDKSNNNLSATMKAIKLICQPTDYKEECVKSLSSEAGNTTDSKELIKAAFTAAMDHINEAAKKSNVLKELEKDPRAKKALDSCKELMDSSTDEFKNSFDQLGDFDGTRVDELLNDLRIWLSAAITYQETCLDAFQNTTGDAGEKMRAALKSAMQMSSNSLAIVSDLSKVLSNFNFPSLGRRLLEHDVPVLGHGELYPDWFTDIPGSRRLLAASPAQIKPDVTVAKDGSGQFKTINEALPLIPKNSNKTFVIYIKEGVYQEYVELNKSMTHVMMIGDGPHKTRITGNKNFVDGIPTFKTCTVGVSGDYFIAKNIGIANTAGAEKHQAVALKVQSDFSIFYNCSFDGYQDTLYAHTKRQFYRDCTISGTIDFVFGDSAAVFQSCTFVVRKPMDNQQCIVTAQGRKERRQPSAIILLNSKVVADPALYPVRFQRKVYLGRPWKEFSRTIIMKTHLDDLIQPEGWSPWLGNFGINTCFYTEFQNVGPGSNTTQRVKWRGIKTITGQHALDFTPGRFLGGDTWIKTTGVPYHPGFLNETEKA